ncbi:hypothetical protein [Alteromonas gilva]|uniref:Uncharacterized protein n=1 Tax=Alteromonas gilva TaxID=2987522 RepID=A0ABT5L6Y5_9ALTE|nr:hypothetical protein [Alteromonas gilva]MDC8832799.1 hypothetical protein [Alteromonas gilva]
MSKTTMHISVSLSEDEKTATIRISNRSNPIIAGVLGVEKDNTGSLSKIYLNRLIHNGGKYLDYQGYLPSGCISTILTKAA